MYKTKVIEDFELSKL